MSFYLDPKDVLKHLNQLGYRNITKDQLREFIQDLKKLIKHDMKQASSVPLDMGAYVGMTLNELTHDSSSMIDTTVITTTTNHTSMEDTRTTSENSELYSSSTYSTSCTDSDTVDCSNRPKTHKVVITSQPADCRPICMQAAIKPKSSFIRPWNLAGSTFRNADPVTLFHRYQAAWKLQKLPGEDSHAELRWIIRERMLGREVHPRPILRASSAGGFRR